MIFTSKFITKNQHIPHCSVDGCQKDNIISIRQSSKKDLTYETTESRLPVSALRLKLINYSMSMS